MIDDDADVRDVLVRALERDGHVVAAAQSLGGARASLRQSDPEVVVLDVALPDGTGVELCRELRAEGSQLSILLLTARSEVAQRVEGLDAGADDFLGKPFAIAELRARVRALGRRRAAPLARPRIEQEGLSVDLAARRAERDGRAVTLTAREWAILDALAARDGRLVARATLLEEVWGEATESTAGSLEVLIARIRRKLGDRVIRTLRGEGYSLEPR